MIFYQNYVVNLLSVVLTLICIIGIWKKSRTPEAGFGTVSVRVSAKSSSPVIIRAPLPLPLRIFGALVTLVFGPKAGKDFSDPEGMVESVARAMGVPSSLFGKTAMLGLKKVCANAEKLLVSDRDTLHWFGIWNLSEVIQRSIRRHLYTEWQWRINKETLQNYDMEDPIWVVGPPRSGTTATHRFLSARGGHYRHMTLAELFSWGPSSGFFSWLDENVINAVQIALWNWTGKVANADALHYVRSSTAEEDLWSMAMSFTSTAFPNVAPVNDYQDWLTEEMSEDIKLESIQLHKRWLTLWHYEKFGHLPVKDRPRLVLKDPLLSGRIRQLLDVFSNCKIVVTHRDPVKTTISSAKLHSVLKGTACSNLDVDENAIHSLRKQKWCFRTLLKHVPSTEESADGRIFNLSYSNFVKNPLAGIERIWRWIGDPLTEAEKIRVQKYIESNVQHKHGVNYYDLSMFPSLGASEQELNKHFEDYRSKFSNFF